jgi:predicted DNA binding protein
MAAGYFDVPRRLSLTELASQLGMAVSSLSEILAVAEKKLLQNFQTTSPI